MLFIQKYWLHKILCKRVWETDEEADTWRGDQQVLLESRNQIPRVSDTYVGSMTVIWILGSWSSKEVQRALGAEQTRDQGDTGDQTSFKDGVTSELDLGDELQLIPSPK